MAVLSPERTEEAPEQSVRRRLSTLPRPRRQGFPTLPDDRRLAAILTAVLGVATLLARLWDLSYPAHRVFDQA